MGEFIAAILGNKKDPAVSTEAIDSTEEKKKRTKQAKNRLISTGGGISGQELQPGQVGGGQNLFGN